MTNQLVLVVGARAMTSARRENRLRELKAELVREGYEIAIHPADASSRSR